MESIKLAHRNHRGTPHHQDLLTTRKRKGRGSCNNVAKDERKRQRMAAFLLATQGDTEAGTWRG